MPRPLCGETSIQTVLKARHLRGQLTSSEEVLWSALRDSRMQGIKFRRQHPFGPYMADFFCVQAQLAIELDGGIHERPEQREYDAERTAYLEGNGLRVLRFRNEEIADRLDEVLMKILEAASPTPQPPPSPDIRQEREGEPPACPAQFAGHPRGAKAGEGEENLQ